MTKPLDMFPSVAFIGIETSTNQRLQQLAARPLAAQRQKLLINLPTAAALLFRQDSSSEGGKKISEDDISSFRISVSRCAWIHPA